MKVEDKILEYLDKVIERAGNTLDFSHENVHLIKNIRWVINQIIKADK